MKNKFLFSIVIFYAILAHGQTNFEKGYFIDKEGKRVDCLIKNARWLDTPQKVYYKMDTEREIISFDAESVDSFQVVGDSFFVSVHAVFPETERFVNAKSDLKEPKLVERTVFVKQLVKGPTGLYQYRANNDEVFLLQDGNEPPLPLVYKEYILAGSNDVRKNNRYKRQLLQYLNCMPASEIQKVSYDRLSLSDFVKSHNRCLGGDQEEKITKSNEFNKKLQLKVLGGIMFYGYETIIENVNVDYGGKISPLVGFELEKHLPFNNNKWSIFLSGAYAAYNTAGVIGETEISELKLNQLIFNLGGRHYMYMTQESGIFLDVGITISSNVKREFAFIEGISTARTNVLPFNFGGSLGTGYSFGGKYQLGVRYFLGTSINEDATDENNLKRFGIFAAIRL